MNQEIPMRTVVRVIGIFAAALVAVGGFYVWSESRSLGAPSAAEWRDMKEYQDNIAAADAMFCTPEDLNRRARIEEAKEKLSRLVERYTLSQSQAEELNKIASAHKHGDASAEACTESGKLVSQAIVMIDRE